MLSVSPYGPAHRILQQNQLSTGPTFHRICHQLSLELLGLEAGHEPLARRQAYRQLSRHIHPDRCRHPAAPDVFSALQLAVETLQERPLDAGGSEDAGETFVRYEGPLREFPSVAALEARNEEALAEARVPGRLVLHALAVPWEAAPDRLAAYARPLSSDSPQQHYALFLPAPASFEGCDGEEPDAQPRASVSGMVLVSAQTALRGRFPLNGTYFQTNEVFLDHSTVGELWRVPRALLDTCPSCPIFIGHSIHHMAKVGGWAE